MLKDLFMEVIVLRVKITLMAVAIILIATIACKKNDPKVKENTEPVFTQMPDTAMFVSTFDENTGTTIYALNATTGAVLTKYKYPFDSTVGWCAVLVGNGFLYNAGANKIDALNINTGKVLWTDAVNNVTQPILHDETFYGLSAGAEGRLSLYALDATKPTKTFMWQVPLVSDTRPDIGGSRNVAYYNGLIYVTNGNYVDAFDAKTGVKKWQINSNSTGPGYSLSSLQQGYFTLNFNIIDAVTGTQINTVTPPIIPPSFPQNIAQSSMAFATKESSFVQIRHVDASPGWSKLYLSRIDNATGAEKWHVNFGGGYVRFDSVSYVSHIWKDRLVIRRVVTQGAGRYGENQWDNHRLIDINTGLNILDIDDNPGGLTVSTFIVGNTIYLNKRFQSTLSGLPYPIEKPIVDYYLAVDLNTGKQKWNINKLLADYTGAVSSCVYIGGKGYSINIQ